MEFYHHGTAGDVVILAADGGLNSQTAHEFAEQLLTRIDDGLTKLVVDCENLDYISTVGLSTLIRLHKRIREHGGEIRMCNLRGMIPDVMRVTRLERLFGIYASVDEAVASF